MSNRWISEGKARFQIGKSFYRPKSKLTRDLGILAAAVLRQQHGELQVLDALTGCGVRSLRYALEANADFLWVNDGNPELKDLITGNLSSQLRPDQFRLSFLSMQKLLARFIDQGHRFNWVDLDCFGTPMASLTMAIAVTKIGGCLYLTATDGKSLSGQQSSQALRHFYAYTRHHPAVHEQGVRVLAGAAIYQARQQGFNLEPLFSFFCGQTYRVLLRLQPQSPPADQDYGFLGYCHHCGQFQTVGWRSLNRSVCPRHPEPNYLSLSGPMWLGPLHSGAFIDQMTQLAEQWTWLAPSQLLERMQTEATMPPYYYPLAEVGARGRMDIPPKDLLISTLKEQGFRACESSLFLAAIKTDAPLNEVLQLAKGLIRP
ncbi:MAG: tRNA (guanine-N1)-methyltransferase [Acaryochloridaceae cyanobacterium RL_2_7]|nr:tRNA (guanine-N1)-methyltransferase [Acaryochloridaceae cyanobacterium RL_2_7]